MSFDLSYKGSVEKQAVGDQQRSMYKTSSILKNDYAGIKTRFTSKFLSKTRSSTKMSYLSFLASLFASFTSEGTNFLSSLHF